MSGRRRRPPGRHFAMARVRRHYVAGEQVAVTLELLRDDEMIELDEGAEFVTMHLQVDPWLPPAR